MNASKLRRTLKSGGHVFGCMLSQMASTRFEQVLAGSTLDYAVIDSEHGSRDRTEIQNLTGMLRRADITPIVRIPIPKSEWVAMALDAGTAGVLVPHCETVEEVQACVATAKWHPLKGEYLRRAVEDEVALPQALQLHGTGLVVDEALLMLPVLVNTKSPSSATTTVLTVPISIPTVRMLMAL